MVIHHILAILGDGYSSLDSPRVTGDCYGDHCKETQVAGGDGGEGQAGPDQARGDFGPIKVVHQVFQLSKFLLQEKSGASS